MVVNNLGTDAGIIVFETSSYCESLFSSVD